MIPGRKFPELSKRAILQNNTGKLLRWSPSELNCSNRFQTRNFTEGNPPPRRFSCEYIKIFRSSTERPNMTSSTPVYYRAAVKRQSTIDPFLKIFQGSWYLDTYFKKKLKGNLFRVELKPVHCRLVTLLKQTLSYLNFYSHIFFVTSLSVSKNWNWYRSVLVYKHNWTLKLVKQF